MKAKKSLDQAYLDTLLTEMHAHGTAPINAHCFDY